MPIIRVTDVRPQPDATCRVSYFVRDIEKEMVWSWKAPCIGDVYNIDADGKKPPERLASPQPNAWEANNDALRWRKPTANGLTRMEILRRRATIRRAVRAYLDDQDFVEIDAPLLVKGTTPDTSVETLRVDDHYLVTSTEYQMKRLAVGGFDRLYSLTQNFRPGDTGRFRNPEFTMLEWGRVGESLDKIEDDAESLVLRALHALDLPEIITYQGQSIDMRAPWERVSVAAMIERLTGVNVDGFDVKACQKAARAAGLDLHQEWENDRDFLFSVLMDHLQPRFGQTRPVFLYGWPLYQTSSATSRRDEKTADRSELFIGGVELSDGFAGQADAALQKMAFDYAVKKREAQKQSPVDLDEKYLKALALGAPHGAGMALGFDRLVMILTDQAHIKNVLALEWDEL